MSKTMTGGCQCGRIRYTATIDNDDAYLCHCRMCQRATGGVSIAFKNLAKADVAWQTDPEWYASSPIARRPFCAKCGTPLGFAFADSERMDLTIGSFDEPSAFVPTEHAGAEGIHEAWIDTRDLPRERTDENATIVKKWRDAGARPPD